MLDSWEFELFHGLVARISQSYPLASPLCSYHRVKVCWNQWGNVMKPVHCGAGAEPAEETQRLNHILSYLSVSPPQ
jgi:hypothetical protein